MSSQQTQIGFSASTAAQQMLISSHEVNSFLALTAPAMTESNQAMDSVADITKHQSQAPQHNSNYLVLTAPFTRACGQEAPLGSSTRIAIQQTDTLHDKRNNYLVLTALISIMSKDAATPIKAINHQSLASNNNINNYLILTSSPPSGNSSRTTQITQQQFNSFPRLPKDIALRTFKHLSPVESTCLSLTCTSLITCTWPPQVLWI